MLNHNCCMKMQITSTDSGHYSSDRDHVTVNEQHTSKETCGCIIHRLHLCSHPSVITLFIFYFQLQSAVLNHLSISLFYLLYYFFLFIMAAICPSVRLPSLLLLLVSVWQIYPTFLG